MLENKQASQTPLLRDTHVLKAILRDRTQADLDRGHQDTGEVGAGTGRPLGIAYALLLGLGGRFLCAYLNVMLFTCMYVPHAPYVLSQLANGVINFLNTRVTTLHL